MAQVFGLDFGTTNTLGVLRVGDRSITVPDPGGQPVPSVVAFVGDRTIVGQEANESLDRSASGVIHDAVRSPKSFLGTGESLFVAGVKRSPRDLVGLILQHVVSEARTNQPDYSFDRAVVTVPVDMDGRGRRELREAARDAGLTIQQFVHEPLAALYGYLRESENYARRLRELADKPILVVDWGGGTLDLTLCKVVGDQLVQLHNRGEHRVGGDRFDELLRNVVLRRHYEQHGLGAAAQRSPGADALLRMRVERAKIRLSDSESELVFVPNFLAIEGDVANIRREVTRADLEQAAFELLGFAAQAIDSVLAAAETSDQAVELVLLTGGMAGMPTIQRQLTERFGPSRVPALDQAKELIAIGAGWIAHDARRLTLAKPLEIVLPNNGVAELLESGTELPIGEEVRVDHVVARCVDPRSGLARVTLPARPLPARRRAPIRVSAIATRSYRSTRPRSRCRSGSTSSSGSTGTASSRLHLNPR